MNVSIIIPVQNEEATLAPVLEELQQLAPYEIVVVVNGSTDRSREIAENYGCNIVYFKEPLGIDVGRAIGAKAAKGDILLFVDGDIVIGHQQLIPFIKAIEEGWDIALNDLDWTLKRKIRPHPTAVAKFAVNHMLGRGDLSIGSMVAIPHAIKKTALEKIGWRALACPPLAYSMAVLNQLKIVAPASVDVIGTNKIRPNHHGKMEGSPFSFSTSVIIGDHLQAISRLIAERGPRGGLTDGNRNRSFLHHYPQPSKPRDKKAKFSAIIPAGKEPDTIKGVIDEVKKAGVDEIIVVLNGADKQTKQRAMDAGAEIVEFKDPLGHNIPRAIGAMHSTGEICLFIDSDFIVKAEDLVPFLKAAEDGVDVALNDLECLLDLYQPLHAVSAAKYLLNSALKRPDLTMNSLTAVPHAIRRNVIERIGFDYLMNPPLFQAKALLEGFNVKPVHYVDVVKPNRLRKEHIRVKGRVASTDRILGDHVEAFSHLFHVINDRCGYTDGKRKWEFLENHHSAERKKVAVIGLGYVGLPLALHIASENYEVAGIDMDPRKIESLQKGKSYIPDVSDSTVAERMNGRFKAMLPENGSESVKQASYIIITVPTPINEKGEPDLEAMVSATHFIEKHLQNGQTLIYESSTYPGTMEDVILPILSKKGMKVGEDFFLCYSPERIDPANKNFTLKSIPKIVSGQTKQCLEKIKSFYGTIFDQLVLVSSPKIAELAKIFENVQRLVNISLVNEIDTLCRKLNIDFYESLQAASTKPFGFTPYWPGPGIGGHCIPVDPLYLQWKLGQHGLTSQLIQSACEINDNMPKEVAERVKNALEEDEKNILVIGLTYKKDVNDVRESPALKIFKTLLAENYNVCYHDPYIPSVVLDGNIHQSIPLSEMTLNVFDLVLILTDHSGVDYELLSGAKKIIDTRGVLAKRQRS